MRLCKEIKDFIGTNATVIVDGGDIGRFAARVIKVHQPGHWLDPGPMGTLGIGTGYAMACKLARPESQVLIIHGDGSFGLNAMEFDTMVRHNIKVISVISNNGSWGQVKQLQLSGYGRELGVKLSQTTRYDKLVESLGGHGEFVERPAEIRPALERAFASPKPACINVITDELVSYTEQMK
jgi:acetolactate synthase-1/2/3 large subunit